MLPLPIILLPTLGIYALGSLGLFPVSGRQIKLAVMGLRALSLSFAIPFSFALFGPKGVIKRNKVEPEIQEATETVYDDTPTRRGTN